MENQNISFILTQHANLIPNSVAIITDEIEITYKELDTYISNISYYFLEQGIKFGDNVILSLDNELLLLISMLGLARIGAPFCTISSSNSQLIVKETQDKIDARFIVLSVNKQIDNNLIKIEVDFANLKKSKNIDLYIKKFSGLEILMYVKGSGTTGKSKIIPISHLEQLERIKLAQTWMPITKKDNVSSLLNLYYNAPKLLYFEALYYGARIVLLNKKSLLNTNLRIDILHSSVYYVENIIQQLTEDTKKQFQNLKVLFLGGSTVSNILRFKIFSNLTKNLYIRYGTNEIGTISVIKYSNTHDEKEELVGKPIGNTLVQIVDENDKEKPKGEIGFIRVKNLGMIKKYLDDDEATKKAFKNGWFYPGDLGKFTQDNQLVFCGRSDNMMIVNGNNIYPSQIENVITSHFAVKDAVAIPVKHPIHQDIPICAVVLKKNIQISKNELMNYCIERLGLYSPKEIVFLDEIPRNEQSKVIKVELMNEIIQKLNMNITDKIELQANLIPNNIAIYYENIEITFKELDNYIWQVSNYLFQNNIEENDVIANIFNDELTLFISMLATARIGATVFNIPINTPYLLLDEMLKKVNTKYIITDTKNIIKSDFEQKQINLMDIINSQKNINKKIKSLNSKLYWLIISGSGTTGKSKYIPVTHEQFIHCINHCIVSLNISSKDKYLSLMHYNYSSPKERALATIYAGGSIIICKRNLKIIFDIAEFYNPTILESTVYHTKQLMELNSKLNKFINIRIFLLTASTVSDTLRKEVFEKLCKKLWIRFGTNETGLISICNTDDGLKNKESVGKTIFPIQIEIVDEKDKEKALGEIGHIRVKSPGMIEGYLNDKEATKRAFRNGWFYTGDLGKFNQDNQLIYCGRSDDMMIMNGNNIYPAQIENIITSHEVVKDAVALPIKHPIYQDIPICAVVLKEEKQISKNELMDYCVERLGFASPKEIVFLDEIPRNEQGKIVKKELIDKVINRINIKEKN